MIHLELSVSHRSDDELKAIIVDHNIRPTKFDLCTFVSHGRHELIQWLHDESKIYETNYMLFSLVISKGYLTIAEWLMSEHNYTLLPNYRCNALYFKEGLPTLKWIKKNFPKHDIYNEAGMNRVVTRDNLKLVMWIIENHEHEFRHPVAAFNSDAYNIQLYATSFCRGHPKVPNELLDFLDALFSQVDPVPFSDPLVNLVPFLDPLVNLVHFSP